MASGIRTTLTIVAIVCFLVLALPLGIASIVLSRTEGGQCDYRDQMGLDIKDWLLGCGISSVIVACLIAFFGITSLCIGAWSAIPIYATLLINASFGTAWFVVGAVILFRSNIQCIVEASVPIIYALVLWGLTFFSLFSL